MSGKLTLKIPRRTVEPGSPHRAVSSTRAKRRRDSDDDVASSDEEVDTPAVPVSRSSRPGRRASAGVAAAVSALKGRDPSVDSDEEQEEQSSGGSDSDDGKGYQPPTPKLKASSSKAKTHQRTRRIVSDSEDASDGGTSEDDDRSKTEVRLKRAGSISSVNSKKERPTVGGKTIPKPPPRKGRRPSEPAEAAPKPSFTRDTEPPLKKKKLPTITKRNTPTISARPAASTPKAFPSSTGKLGLPTAIPTGSITGSKDFDLNDTANVAALMKKAAMMQEAERDPKQEIYDKMRAEAKKVRAEEAKKDTFDLMAGTEKMKAFEIQLEQSNALSAPHILAHPITRWLEEKESKRPPQVY